MTKAERAYADLRCAVRKLGIARARQIINDMAKKKEAPE